MGTNKLICFNTLHVGERAKLMSFGDLSKPLRLRLYGLGLHLGAELSLAHIAPLGCPVAIQVGNTLLSVRRGEMQSLQLEKI